MSTNDWKFGFRRGERVIYESGLPFGYGYRDGQAPGVVVGETAKRVLVRLQCADGGETPPRAIHPNKIVPMRSRS